MVEKLITETIVGTHFDIDDLIEKLQTVRRMSNGEVSAELSGSFGYGYRIQCKWTRPKTEEEIAAEEALVAKAQEADKEARRRQWEKLKEEFGDNG
jgi:hypothetical protein